MKSFFHHLDSKRSFTYNKKYEIEIQRRQATVKGERYFAFLPSKGEDAELFRDRRDGRIAVEKRGL